jgi:hypothetical protein
MLTQNSAGIFYLNGTALTTTRASMAPGYYSVRVSVVAQLERWKESGVFIVQVTST